MKLTINTLHLQRLLNRVGKCATNNKMLPLTCMTCIKAKDGTTQLITTSGSDYCIAVDTDGYKDEEFYAVVDNDVFYKLVAKTSTDFIHLELSNHHIIFTGNGKYTLDLPTDENGELIKFPEPDYKDTEVVAKLTSNDLAIINKANRANLADLMAEPCYSYYYLGDKVLTSDRSVICATNIEVTDKPILISNIAMSILDTDIEIATNDKQEVVFIGENYKVLTKSSEYIDDYNSDAIMNLVNTPLDYKFNVDKEELLTVLDRLGLFINAFDKNCLSVSIKGDKLTFSNVKANSSESIPIRNNHDFSFNIDITLLSKQVGIMNKNVFEFQYGSDMFIKLVTDEVTEIIPLLVE